MTAMYKWISPLKADEVVKRIEDSVHFRPFGVAWKHTDYDGVKFTLWYTFSRVRFSGIVPILEGFIKDAPDGCEVSATKRSLIVLNTIQIVMFIALFVVGIFAAFGWVFPAESVGGHFPFETGALLCLLAIGGLLGHLYLHKKYGDMKHHLEIISNSTMCGYRSEDC